MANSNWPFDIDDIANIPSMQLNSAHGLESVDDTYRSTISDLFGRQLAEYLNFNMANGPWLAGGMLRKLYHNELPGKSDWDIWFASSDQFDAAVKALSELNGCRLIYSSDNALTYEYVLPGTFEDEVQVRKIQLIRAKYFTSARDVIDHFDFTVCQICTDGKTVVVGEDTVRDLKSRSLRKVKTSNIVRPGIAGRLVKYIVYGYKPVPELLDEIKQASTTIMWTVNGSEYDAI